MHRNGILAILYTVALIIVSPCEAAGQVYRYLNDKGVPVIDQRIPPEFVSKGYDILDAGTLQLIQRVPRQLTEEELRLRNTDEARAQLKVEEERRLKAWDESLMIRYSSVDDIEAARNRAVQDLQIRISILKSNLTSIKSRIEKDQQTAANIERRGGAVPSELLGKIQILRQEIEDTEQSIEIRKREIEDVRASFQRDIERFKKLADRVEMRRRGVAAPASDQRK